MAVRRRRPNPGAASTPGASIQDFSPNSISAPGGSRVRVQDNIRGSVPLRGAAQAATNNANANRYYDEPKEKNPLHTQTLTYTWLFEFSLARFPAKPNIEDH